MTASSGEWTEAEVEPVPGLPRTTGTESEAGGPTGYADRPIVRPEDDRLGRGPVVGALEHLLAEPDEHGGLTLAILGEPGTGKSSVMHMLRQRLAGQAATLWLDAWQHARPGLPLWQKLLMVLVEELGAHGLAMVTQTEYSKATFRREIEELAACLMRSGHPGQSGGAGGASLDAIELALTMSGLMGERWNPAELIQRLSSKEVREVGALLDYRRSARRREEFLALDELRLRLHNLLSEQLSARGRRLYVFVDHLDRCLPEEALAAFEALRLLCELPGMALVLAFDPRPLERAGRTRLGEDSPEEVPPSPASLLERLVDVPFRLPPLNGGQIEALVQHWCAARGAHAVGRTAPLIAAGASSNPRRIKRVLVGLRLLEQFGLDRELPFLAKLLVLKASHPDEFHLVRAEPVRLRERERQAKEAGAPVRGRFPIDGRHRCTAMLALEPWFEPLSDQELGELVALSDGVL